MTTALRHDEAITRGDAITVHAQTIELDLSGAQTERTYPVAATIELTSQVADTFLDYLGESVESVLIDGQPAPVDFDGSRIALHVAVDTRVTVTVRGRSAFSRTGQGLHRFTDTADAKTYLYSHLEPSDARRIYPCFDQPDMKTRFTVSMTVPEGWQALSNQRAVSHDGNTVIFRETPLLSTYLTCFAAGEYVAKLDTWAAEDGREIELGLWARASMAQYVDDEFLEITKQGLSFYDKNFGTPYPWGKYDSILVPEYNLGAMENPGLVTFTEQYIFRGAATRAQHAGRANTILHEMAHMWFGDLVTPKWWNDLWLKESFAEFMGADASVHATDYHEAWANFAGQRKNWAYEQDQLPTTHPIAAVIDDVDAARQNFDGITYAKGAAVLKQLVHYVGRFNFYAGARDYFRNHAFEAATFEDLLDALAPHTDKDLQAWADAWLRTTGVDTLVPAIEDGTLTITRHDGHRPHRLNAGFYKAGKLVETVDVVIPADQDAVSVDAPEADLVVLNDSDHTYAKVRLDEHSLVTALVGLREIEDELTRAVVWTALWQATRDGELPVSTYLSTVANNIGADSNSAVATQVLGNAAVAARRYTKNPDPHLDSLAETYWTLVNNASGDIQLSVARVLVGVLAKAPSTTSTPRLRALLDGEVRGLDVDQQLRWDILAALAAREALDDGELDEELARDNTLTGATAHLQAANAAPGNKERVFDLIMSNPSQWSNDELNALIRAFNAPAPESAADVLRARIAGSVKAIWAANPIETANKIIRGLYPDAETVPVTDDMPRALRRVVLELNDIAERRARLRSLNP